MSTFTLLTETQIFIIPCAQLTKKSDLMSDFIQSELRPMVYFNKEIS